jgi:hypothetical protein
MSLYRGLRLGMSDLTTLQRINRRWLARSWVSWRDGTIAGTGGVGNAINPATGAVQSGPMTMDLAVAGLPPIRMGFAWDAITNLVPVMTTNTALLSNTLAGLSRTIIESTATSVHRAAGTSAISISSTYTRSFTVSNVSASRSVQVLVRDNAGGGANYAGVLVDAVTGSVSDLSAGWSTSNRSCVAVPGGWLVRFTITTTGTLVGTVQSYYSLVSGSSNYAGDGASGVVITGDTITPTTDFAPRLAEAVARTADSWIWTTPAVVPQNCEITHIGMSPYADGDAGVSSMTWMMGVNNPLLYRGGSGQLTAQHYNGTTVFQPNYARTLPSRATSFVQRQMFYPDLAFAGYGSALGTGVATTPTLTASPTLRVGHHSTAGRASRAANALIITPGGCTPAERVAQAVLFHNRPVGLAA